MRKNPRHLFLVCALILLALPGMYLLSYYLIYVRIGAETFYLAIPNDKVVDKLQALYRPVRDWHVDWKVSRYRRLAAGRWRVTNNEEHAPQPPAPGQPEQEDALPSIIYDGLKGATLHADGRVELDIEGQSVILRPEPSSHVYDGREKFLIVSGHFPHPGKREDISYKLIFEDCLIGTQDDIAPVKEISAVFFYWVKDKGYFEVQSYTWGRD